MRSPSIVGRIQRSQCGGSRLGAKRPRGLVVCVCVCVCWGGGGCISSDQAYPLPDNVLKSTENTSFIYRKPIIHE